MIPKWIEWFIDTKAFDLNKDQLENINTNSRKDVLWKYIVMNVLSPEPIEYTPFSMTNGEFFMTADNEQFEIKNY